MEATTILTRGDIDKHRFSQPQRDIHMSIRPKYISFDCYGTLTRMRMGDMAREMFADRIPA